MSYIKFDEIGGAADSQTFSRFAPVIYCLNETIHLANIKVSG